MNVRSALLFCAKELRERAKKDITSTVTIDREKIKCVTAAQQIEDLAELVYTKLDTAHIRVVTRCKECRYYKRFRSKKNPKSVRYLCTLQNCARDPDFYCANGKEGSDNV